MQLIKSFFLNYSISDIIAVLTFVIAFLGIVFKIIKFLYEKIIKLKKIKKLKSNVLYELKNLDSYISKSSLIDIVYEKKISVKNIQFLENYLSEIEELESSHLRNDILSIINLFKHIEELKDILHKYINIRNRGINKGALFQDSNYGLFEKNLSELTLLIKKTIPKFQ